MNIKNKEGNLRVSALEVSLVDNQVEGGGNLSLGINGVSLVVNNVVKDGGNLRINDGIGQSCENAAKVYAAETWFKMATCGSIAPGRQPLNKTLC